MKLKLGIKQKSKPATFVGSSTEPQNEKQRKMNEIIGRNDPCHCNSGKKFKKCCLQ